MKKILLSGGGTGGHIYPALSIVKAVRKRYPDVEVAYIGTQKGLEAKIVPKEGDIRFFDVDIQGFRRKLSLDNFQTVAKFIRAVRDCKSYIREFQPDVVVGTGGYVSGPSVYAAAKAGVPTLILEPDVLPGLTTRFLSRYVDVVAISLSGSEKHLTSAKRILHTGNPRGTEVVEADARAGRKSLGLAETDKPIVLFVGGSRGARPLNEAVAQLLPRIAENDHIHFVYVTGEVHYDSVVANVDVNRYTNLTIKPFIYNMPDVLAATALVVGRAGASTLAEITALGVPSILVPSPYVTNNHQEANARWVEENGAGRMVLEKDLNGERLWDVIDGIVNNDERHRAMSNAARRLGRPDAAEVLVDELTKLSHIRREK
ncbi:UDP-N-acetylglucosamine--N-acetylmuramyl-(pentapeptide) pyrophosphoryl-undecaprenol N-acetylglucosamine transferase 1 [Marinithermofilum abyssi]|uniref:UDP-N-acetylglucosamine--N-acetylmuramyl-(pentapeptide) pyrophosphoryl-undecaprenol N-acetylglucosamine transferase n=1 Tax=Marinithermofilum abyssi TaxID=1571185 RepID=A0A8J2VC71_9BACL|nr:undecaprenyldiphospho-muramoylpentapeptide beta-N-acetylglucosaminyltransferase [Marinithermofilum abyssi]GGE22515.1 UDP-N-acetylglucosamine--N-acetylmuramyl-(pentapeptide) pyrophosphoryl-undecaprenol N-acetylglucosamine transferase 1 [Marinithermofilum abyssi]